MVEKHEFIGLNSLFFVSIVLLCLLLGGLLKRYRISYLPESGASILFGLLLGLFFNLAPRAETSVLQFNPEIFFFLLLPPIIFEAGYTLKRKDFFSNLGSITLYAVLGTIVTTLVFGFFLYAFALAGAIPLSATSPLECLAFGAAISATDPVATLALLNSREVNAHPLLYSLIFGESVLNDAVAIVLYKTFSAFLEVEIEAKDAATAAGTATSDIEVESPFTIKTMMAILGTFVGVSLGSICVGVGVALLCSAIFRRINFSHFPVYEFTLVLLFAYVSYFLAEICYLSGIMSLFFCSVCLAHYNLYNISTNAQIATQEAFKSMAQISETFVFAYIGITAGLSISSTLLRWNAPLVFIAILGCFLARAANVFPITLIINTIARTSSEERIPFRMQVPLWFAGLRGAVAFALSLNFVGGNQGYVVTTTLSVVLFTTLVCGALTLPVLRWTGMDGGADGVGADGAGARRGAGGGVRGSRSLSNDITFELLPSRAAEGSAERAAEQQRAARLAAAANGGIIGLGPNGEPVDASGQPVYAGRGSNGVGDLVVSPGRYEMPADEAGRDQLEDGRRGGGELAVVRPRPKKQYGRWVQRFKEFDRTFMRKWFGGKRETIAGGRGRRRREGHMGGGGAGGGNGDEFLVPEDEDDEWDSEAEEMEVQRQRELKSFPKLKPTPHLQQHRVQFQVPPLSAHHSNHEHKQSSHHQQPNDVRSAGFSYPDGRSDGTRNPNTNPNSQVGPPSLSLSTFHAPLAARATSTPAAQPNLFHTGPDNTSTGSTALSGSSFLASVLSPPLHTDRQYGRDLIISTGPPHRPTEARGTDPFSNGSRVEEEEAKGGGGELEEL